MKIWPGIKILDRYIIRKFIGTYLFAIAMIIVVVVLFDYVEKLDDFTEMKAPVQAIIFDYYCSPSSPVSSSLRKWPTRPRSWRCCRAACRSGG